MEIPLIIRAMKRGLVFPISRAFNTSSAYGDPSPSFPTQRREWYWIFRIGTWIEIVNERELEQTSSQALVRISSLIYDSENTDCMDKDKKPEKTLSRIRHCNGGKELILKLFDTSSISHEIPGCPERETEKWQIAWCSCKQQYGAEKIRRERAMLG